MVNFRNRGGGLKRGLVKYEVYLFLSQKKGWIPEDDIVGYIREKFNIIERKGINRHLKFLEKYEILISKEIKGTKKWKIKDPDNAFLSMIEIYPKFIFDLDFKKMDNLLFSRFYSIVNTIPGLPKKLAKKREDIFYLEEYEYTSGIPSGNTKTWRLAVRDTELAKKLELNSEKANKINFPNITEERIWKNAKTI